MKKNSLIIRCGSMVLAAAVLVTGAWYTERTTDDLSIPQMVEYIDTEDGSIVIPQEEVPLATKPTVKTTKKTKRTVKKSKLKKKATKTAKTTKRSKKTKTVKQENSKQKVTTDTTVKTTVVSATKKSSDIKTVTTTVETTVKTTTTNKPQTTNTETAANTSSAASTTTAAAASSDEMQTVTSLNVRSMAPKADAVVLNAFENLGFKIEVNPSAGYSGYFSVQAHSITLKKSSGDTIYHELGHFVGWLAGNVDNSTEFKAIYNNEKGALQSANAQYLTQNSSEYFAESYKEYVLSPQNLQSTRPQTYAFVKNAVAKITEARVATIKAAYTKAYWS